MDTITHGIAGALIAKAIFRGEDLFGSRVGGALTGEKNGLKTLPTAGRPPLQLQDAQTAKDLPLQPQEGKTAEEPLVQRRDTRTGKEPPAYRVRRARVLTWVLMLGAIFPDADVFRDIFSHDRLLIVTWHRSITHSLVLLPLWALLLAALTHWYAKRQNWETPSFAALSGIYGVGILSHILLDLATTFGTMIWSPLEWARPAWDLLFIVDFTLSAVMLVPQFLAWVYSQPEKMRRRAVGLCVVFLPVPIVIARLAEAAGVPISDRVTFGAMILLALIFMFPAVRGWGLKVRYVAWNRVGFAAALGYVAVAFFAHRVALERIHKFAELDHLQVESIGTLPLPPSVWHWDGLVRSVRGVYELRMDLSEKAPSDSELLAQEHRYYPDAPPNSYIEAARRLPQVQKVLWFARFPVTRFHKEGDGGVVEISDIRFVRPRSGGSTAFTYRVRFGADGNVISQGWETRQ